MKIGLALPQIGPLATADNIRNAAVGAEAAGYSSVWVFDRILGAHEPRSVYPASADGRMPEELATVLDPIGTLTLAAAVTEQVRLGTSVLVAPWYPPVLLARMLTTLDVISRGRVIAGLGLGWSLDEYDSVAVPMAERGSRLDETLDVLDAVWNHETVGYRGRRVNIAPSTIEPKPVQIGGPPVVLGAFSPAGLERVARRADGWNPVALPFEFVGPMWASIRDMAAGFGRDADALQLIVRANFMASDRAIDDEGRMPFVGSLEQIAADIEATRALGTHELILGSPAPATDLSEMLEQLDAVTAAAGLDVQSVMQTA